MRGGGYTGLGEPQAPGLPTVQRPVVILIVAGGAAAFGLSVAAEFTRISSYQILENANRELYCSYPQSLATLFASLACGILFVAQIISLLAGGRSWARPLFQRHVTDNKAMVGRAVQRVAIVIFMDTIFFLAAEALLISAAIENKYHVSSTPYGEMFMTCSMVSEGIFLTAAVLTAIAAVLMVAYYLYAIRANEELWLANYVAAPVIVDMEAFSRDTSRTSITAIISDKRDDDAGYSSGRLAAVTNTPIHHARLA